VLIVSQLGLESTQSRGWRVGGGGVCEHVLQQRCQVFDQKKLGYEVHNTFCITVVIRMMTFKNEC